MEPFGTVERRGKMKPILKTVSFRQAPLSRPSLFSQVPVRFHW
jgi:hypothetical protein